jgi:hypothetical protein
MAAGARYAADPHGRRRTLRGRSAWPRGRTLRGRCGRHGARLLAELNTYRQRQQHSPVQRGMGQPNTRPGRVSRSSAVDAGDRGRFNASLDADVRTGGTLGGAAQILGETSVSLADTELARPTRLRRRPSTCAASGAAVERGTDLHFPVLASPTDDHSHRSEKHLIRRPRPDRRQAGLRGHRNQFSMARTEFTD